MAWGVNTADEVFVRVGLCPEDPKGKEWSKIDGSMKTIRYMYELTKIQTDKKLRDQIVRSSMM